MFRKLILLILLLSVTILNSSDYYLGGLKSPNNYIKSEYKNIARSEIKDTVFSELKSSQGDLLHGEAIFKINNIYDAEIELSFDFFKVSGDVTSYEYYIEHNVTYNTTKRIIIGYDNVTEQVDNIKCYNITAKNGTLEQCFKSGTVKVSTPVPIYDEVISFHNKTEWLKTEIIPKGYKGLVKFVAKYSRASTTQSPVTIDWIPTANVKTIQTSLIRDNFVQREVIIDRIENKDWAWFNSSWSYAQNITINSSYIDEELSNFPILVNLSSSNFNFSNAQTDGDDLRFTDAGNTTTLDYEIEYYDATAEEAYVWVEVPTVSDTSDTVIIMYYGNAGASAGENAEGVWANYDGVIHLSETGSDIRLDSTSNDYDFTASGSVDNCEKIYLGKGEDSDYLYIPSGYTDTTNYFSYWFKNSTGTRSQGTIDFEPYDGNAAGTKLTYYTDGLLRLRVNGVYTATSNYYDCSHWCYITWQREGGTTWYVYLNGEKITSYSSQSAGAINPVNFYLTGGQNSDEIRFETNPKDASYIKAEYHSMASADFVSYSTEYEEGGVCDCPGTDTDWVWYFNENCTYNDCDIGTGVVTFNGTGNIYCNGSINITDFNDTLKTGQTVWFNSTCDLRVG